MLCTYHQSKTNHHQSPLTSFAQTGGMLALQARVGFLFPLDIPLAARVFCEPLVKTPVEYPALSLRLEVWSQWIPQRLNK